MSKEKKAEIIERLQEIFSGCSVGILTDYRGLSTAEMTALRCRLRESGIRYQVVKNTMARFAAQRTGRDDLLELFEGPVAIAFGYGEAVKPARVLMDYIDASKVELGIKGGFLSDRLLSAEEVTTLARLPSREVLLAKVVGGMQAPLYALHGYLSAPLRGLAMVLQARIRQLEGE